MDQLDMDHWIWTTGYGPRRRSSRWRRPLTLTLTPNYTPLPTHHHLATYTPPRHLLATCTPWTPPPQLKMAAAVDEILKQRPQRRTGRKQQLSEVA